MEPIGLVLGFLKIVGTGALSQVGVHITDRSVKAAQDLWQYLQKRLPESQTVRQLAEEAVDYQQAVIDLEPIGQDPEFIKLLEEVRSVLASNKELNAKIEALIALPGANTTNIGKQVKVKQSGTGNTQINTFNL